MTSDHEVRGVPADPLAGQPGVLSALLHDLDDAQLRQFVAHWEWRRESNEAQQEGRGVWWADKNLAAGRQECARRRMDCSTSTHRPRHKVMVRPG